MTDITWKQVQYVCHNMYEKCIYYISLLQWNIEHMHEQLVIAEHTEKD